MTVTPKQAALKIIEQMPADASLEDIMYELYFRQRVDRGLQEFDVGQTISHEEVKRNLVKWLQSSGQQALRRISGASLSILDEIQQRRRLR